MSAAPKRRSGESIRESHKVKVTPRSVDAILALVALELVGIGALLVRSSAADLLAPWALYLASGAFLLLALRAALSGAEAHAIALALLMSFLSHGALLMWLLRVPSGAPWAN